MTRPTLGESFSEGWGYLYAGVAVLIVGASLFFLANFWAHRSVVPYKRHPARQEYLMLAAFLVFPFVRPSSRVKLVPCAMYDIFNFVFYAFQGSYIIYATMRMVIGLTRENYMKRVRDRKTTSVMSSEVGEESGIAAEDSGGLDASGPRRGTGGVLPSNLRAATPGGGTPRVVLRIDKISSLRFMKFLVTCRSELYFYWLNSLAKLALTTTVGFAINWDEYSRQSAWDNSEDTEECPSAGLNVAVTLQVFMELLSAAAIAVLYLNLSSRSEHLGTKRQLQLAAGSLASVLAVYLAMAAMGLPRDILTNVATLGFFLVIAVPRHSVFIYMYWRHVLPYLREIHKEESSSEMAGTGLPVTGDRLSVAVAAAAAAEMGERDDDDDDDDEDDRGGTEDDGGFGMSRAVSSPVMETATWRTQPLSPAVAAVVDGPPTPETDNGSPGISLSPTPRPASRRLQAGADTGDVEEALARPRRDAVAIRCRSDMMKTEVMKAVIHGKNARRSSRVSGKYTESFHRFLAAEYSSEHLYFLQEELSYRRNVGNRTDSDNFRRYTKIVDDYLRSSPTPAIQLVNVPNELYINGDISSHQIDKDSFRRQRRSIETMLLNDTYRRWVGTLQFD